MKGSQPTSDVKSRATVFHAGRTCTAPGCSTQLSVYNSAERCWQHADVVFPTFRGRRSAD